jgi:polysaccharide pyruvyl transferase WcaK-like protein
LVPDIQFCCICTNAKAVVATHGINAVPINSRVIKIWDLKSRLDKRVKGAFMGLREEVWQYVRAFRMLNATDMLVIPGTGLVTDAYGLGAWGPYNVFKWSLMAKLRGCQVLFVSVGAGPIRGALGRCLVKSSLSLADYRSYRDDSSMNYLKGIGVRTAHDHVYPDLVFSLPETLISPNAEEKRSRRVVGLGLMDYIGKYCVARDSSANHQEYLENLVTFVKWLLARDCDIRLLLGDDDTHVVRQFKSMLKMRLGSYDEGRVIDEPITSVQQIVSQLARTDIVVATRFHNVLLSLLLNKPVIAISFHQKCASLMSQMGLSEYCHDINGMNAARLIEQFQNAESDVDRLKFVIKQGVERSRRALDEQYALIFKSLVSEPSEGSHTPGHIGSRLPAPAEESALRGGNRVF